jgi:Domain of unknown function (DUF4760)
MTAPTTDALAMSVYGAAELLSGPENRYHSPQAQGLSGDKTVIDLYNKFKANAPLTAFVPDPSDLTRSDYNDTRAFLNICELIAVGVNKGAFSKSVSEAYWGDVIPDAYQTAKQLINIRTTPGEGSRYTYVNLEKLAKRWAKRTKKAPKLVDRS